MEGKEAIECGVRDDVIAANPERELRSNEGNSREQVHDHLRTPEGHLTPGQEVTKEGFCHQAQENSHTKNPDELAWLTIGAVNQCAGHVQIDHDKKHRGASGVHVTDKPAARHFAHDVFNGLKRKLRIGFVVHY